MSKKQFIILLVISSLIISCNNTPKNIPNNTVDTISIDTSAIIVDERNISDSIEMEDIQEMENPDFEKETIKFIQLFNAKDTIELNNYIYPGYGIIVLDNPGAFITLSEFENFNPANTYEGIFFDQYLYKMNIDCNPVYGDIPFYDCENDGWDKEGCYYKDNANVDLVKLYDALVMYMLPEEDPVFRKELVFFDENIIYGVYSTESFIGFYFGYMNDNWYLLCIDRVAPCSA